MKNYLVNITSCVKVEAENNTIAVLKAAEMVKTQVLKAEMFFYDEKEIEERK